MTRTCTASSVAPAETLWALVARPDRWSTWAPHVRGAWGLGSPEVEAGRRGAVRLLGVLPVPARIDAVEPGRSWAWIVGPVHLVHAVEPAPGGCVVSMTLDAPAPVEAAYGPVVALFTRRLAEVAAR
ncbi:hypothetical protein HMPREF0063_11786 [Aeromicrobium marinum DSM 15272]|uniref:Polyketide cyclase/dehydrase n=1 Tax=Aeromicrobium marinum DSM 15272 TaxID=585531 RepID=E2SDK0_9ACTN|nr:SRPBCC family protein [Aeromicrobium marinum]EFQ82577.1 hypothetical protein HMPREF0063_11786 [Aeromicrobium marinum DSM 15272]